MRNTPNFLKTILIGSFFIFVLANLVLAAWYVLHGDIVFSADIARDFFLYREIDQKKIMLIGPRSSVSGLFHGPLWVYINYPAYWLGKGNPVVVGWYWIFLIVLFLIGSFKIADKLFDRLTAYFYVSFLSVYAVFHAKGLFNPHGVFFLLPWFFFLLVRYLQTSKALYLIAHVIVGGLLIQFQLAIGTPYVILSLLLIVYSAIKKKNKKHILVLFLILIPLANFVVFELRHDWVLTQGVQRFLFSHVTDKSLSYRSIIEDRFRVMLTGVEFTRENPGNIRLLIVIIFGIFTWLQIKDNVHKLEYLLFLYFYFGYFGLSFVNKGFILYFYLYPQFSLSFLIFASFLTSNYKRIFIPIFLLILMLNFETAIRNVKSSEAYSAKAYIGKNVDSWKFLYNLSKRVYEQPEETFGYFVYSPDIFGYQPKYAMIYTGSLFDKEAFSFEKKPITYIIAAPHPFMKVEWWKENQVKITGEPEMTIEYKNGYRIEKYLLSEEQVNTPFDPNINPGTHFR